MTRLAMSRGIGILIFTGFIAAQLAAQTDSTARVDTVHRQRVLAVAETQSTSGISLPPFEERLMIAAVGVVTFGGMALFLNVLRARKDKSMGGIQPNTK